MYPDRHEGKVQINVQEFTNVTFTQINSVPTTKSTLVSDSELNCYYYESNLQLKFFLLI